MPDFVSAYYEKCLSAQTAISPHLPRLRALADGLQLVQEFGVKRGASSSALLLGAHRVVSYDILETREARALAVAAAKRWSYNLASSLTAPVIECDLLFVDSLHTFAQCDGELRRHADTVRHRLVFHDTLTFGSIAADGETGRHQWTYTPGVSVPKQYLGIRPAIDDLMIRDRSWTIVAHYTDSHGLLVLERSR